MKRFVSILLLLSMVFSAGCGKQTSKEDASMNQPHEPRLLVVNPTEDQLQKCTEDIKTGVISLKQGNKLVGGPLIDFLHEGEALESEAWVLSGTLRMTLAAGSGKASFRCWSDKDNYAEFILSRSITGSEVLRYIVREGHRLQEKMNEIVTNTLQEGQDWTVQFSLIFCDGFVYLFLQEEGEPMKLITSYAVDWEQCRPRFELTSGADVEFSDLQTLTDPEQVREYYREIGVSGEVLGEKRVLVLGNSGIFFYDLPSTLSRLARQAGYLVEANTVAISSANLNWFTESDRYIYSLKEKELQKDYDIVIMQASTGSINSASLKNTTSQAGIQLAQEIKETGAEPWFLVRAPRNDYTNGLDPVKAAKEYDELFTPMAEWTGGVCTYVNRAWALAYQNTDINLWYKDNQHSNHHGAYLAACVIFSTMFNTSCQVLPDDDLPADEALTLRNIADQVVLEGKTPW